MPQYCLVVERRHLSLNSLMAFPFIRKDTQSVETWKWLPFFLVL